MLATLNLQLLPAELPDETLKTSASLVPDGEGGLPTGFADLLQLRVDDSVASPGIAGELLPQGGSELPLEPDVLSAQLLAQPPVGPNAGAPVPDPLGQALPVTGLPVLPDGPLAGTGSNAAEISLDAVIRYQPTAPIEVAPTEAAVLRVNPLAPAAIAGSLSVTDDVTAAPVLETRSPPVTGQPLVTRHLTRAGDSLALPTPLSNADRSQLNISAALTPERSSITAGQLPAAADVERSLPLPELPLRPMALASADRGDAMAQELAPLLRARPAVAQPAQALHAQLNLQQPLNPFATPAPSVTGSDLSYAAAAQQATDLVSTSVRDSIWGERIGERVIMMASNHLKSAEIRLTPAELGPLRVQVAIDDGATNVTFHAQHAVTRDALEQALPRLREMLADNGLTLGNAEVGDDGVQQGSHDADPDTAAPTAARGETVDGVVEQGPSAERRATVSRGLVDTFA